MTALIRSSLLCLSLLSACSNHERVVGEALDLGEPTPDPDVTEDGAEALPFAWEPGLGRLEIDGSVRGTPVARGPSGEWDSRTAGGGGGDGMLARRGAGPGMPKAAPMMPATDADMGETAGSSGLGAMGEGRGGGGMAESAPMGGSVVPRKKEARQQNTSPLRAGATDDNARYDEFLAYLQTAPTQAGVAGQVDALDVSGRRMIRVLDSRGQPVPAAKVSILDPATERVVWSGHSYGDGRVPFYPYLEVPGTGLPAAGEAPQGGWIVQARKGRDVQSRRWDGLSAEVELSLPVSASTGAVPLDVCFVIDTTGSMGDEIARVKETLLSVTEKLRREQNVDLRYGAVLYRDVGDEYLTRRYPFTADLSGFDQALQGIDANGGGDGPESLNQAMSVTVGGMEWRDNAARVAFVIADAPPHMDYQEAVTYGRASAAALHHGIRVHTVAASGLDDRGSITFRQIAQMTRGEFIFIEYGSVAAAAADHGVTGPVASNNLDGILYERIRREIEGWGREDLVLSRAD